MRQSILDQVEVVEENIWVDMVCLNTPCYFEVFKGQLSIAVIIRWISEMYLKPSQTTFMDHFWENGLQLLGKTLRHIRLGSKHTFEFQLISQMIDICFIVYKETCCKLPTNCLSVFDHFVKLVPKGLKNLQFWANYSEDSKEIKEIQTTSENIDISVCLVFNC